ncbi:MAG: hypothetical protein E2603_19090, partial [Achromobacter sp.]|nr:hypothetical protein [Achromobacter sp.]
MQTDHAGAALDAVLDRLNAALGDKDIDAVAALFQDECYWRDLVLFTWNLRTLEGQDQIRDMLARQLAQVEPVRFGRDAKEAVSDDGGLLQGWIEIETNLARGYGHVRVKDGKIWTLLTTMSELKGHEEPSGVRRPKGAEHGSSRDRQTWLEKREQEAAELGHQTQPYVLIIGGIVTSLLTLYALMRAWNLAFWREEEDSTETEGRISYLTGAPAADEQQERRHIPKIMTVATAGKLGESYNIGGHNEKTNIEVVKTICALLDELRPDPRGSRERLISYVTDRPGHDARYAIDAGKIGRELGWAPKETFETGLRRTVEWWRCLVQRGQGGIGFERYRRHQRLDRYGVHG